MPAPMFPGSVATDAAEEIRPHQAEFAIAWHAARDPTASLESTRTMLGSRKRSRGSLWLRFVPMPTD